jgi:hypothetical protein
MSQYDFSHEVVQQLQAWGTEVSLEIAKARAAFWNLAQEKIRALVFKK